MAAQQNFKPVTVPQPIMIDGRRGTVVFLDDNRNVVVPDHATHAKVVFDDGSRGFYQIRHP
jgi:hypothetical protein